MAPTFDKQLRRFEELIRVGKDPVTGAGLDQIEVETRMLTASLPSRIGVEQIALDNTPFESWFLSKVFIKEEDARAETEELYRALYDPDASEPVPEMGSELMRELAEQLGIPIGPDGSIERSHISPEDRIGYRNGVGKRPEGLFLGYSRNLRDSDRRILLGRQARRGQVLSGSALHHCACTPTRRTRTYATTDWPR